MSRPERLPDEELKGAFRELREYSRGTLDVEHSDVHPIAGLIEDPALREVLMFMAESYDREEMAEISNHATRKRRAEEHNRDADPGEEIEASDVDLEDEEHVSPLDLPASFWRTELAERAIQQNATDSATQAIRAGNISQVSYITGLPSYDSDISGLHAIDQLADWLIHSEATKLIYMAALMGRGKTDLSLTFLQVVNRHYRRFRESGAETPEPHFAANFEVQASGEADVRTINNFDDLEEWAKEVGGSSEAELWFIFDEASTELTAQSGANAQDVAEVMAPFVKKMRKLGVNMIVIGHDKGDVHPAIREIADFVDKTGRKTASFYAGISSREPVGELFSVEGIPPTEWDYDTDDMADWSWGSAVDGDLEQADVDEYLREERNERIARLYELTELSYSDLATAFDISKSTVSSAIESVDLERTEASA